MKRKKTTQGLKILCILTIHIIGQIIIHELLYQTKAVMLKCKNKETTLSQSCANCICILNILTETQNVWQKMEKNTHKFEAAGC